VYIATGNSIIKLPVGALSPVTDVITGISTDTINDSLLVDATDLYWVEVEYGPTFMVVSSSLKKRAKAGGSVTTLATDTRHIEDRDGFHQRLRRVSQHRRRRPAG